MRIANVATYPARQHTCLQALRSIAAQVDVLNVALNEYTDVPEAFRELDNATFHIPDRNLRDLGKFCFAAGDDDDVFLCDDDILYPADYVAWMMRLRAESPLTDPVLGVHGVTYSDYYDGRSRSGRLVHTFYLPLGAPVQMNQLGTGTIHVKGRQMPTFDYMDGSSGFVDIRFARHAHERGYPMICVARGRDWLTEVKNEETLYLSVTRNLPSQALQDVQHFGGLARLVRP
ncbi:hypothetical protein [Paracoccus sediminis]|uniref:Glycosyl transferase family 2 n=1 Tax=Paracoccus sediminis TaxID=1214787 RepID=A0A238Y6N3_9RHOB|nr:hypothetical protein [Paracoccus sediminis]SNR66488.1 hypothetical protein SAMN06265378_11514 [Paracoccus sediminis]